jgi:hypothetical protein
MRDELESLVVHRERLGRALISMDIEDTAQS